MSCTGGILQLKSATLSLVWNWNHYIDTINVTLYKCTLKGPDCNLCASQPARYQCVWRDERCQVARPEAYKAASDNLSCPAPSVDSVRFNVALASSFVLTLL